VKKRKETCTGRGVGTWGKRILTKKDFSGKKNEQISYKEMGASRYGRGRAYGRERPAGVFQGKNLSSPKKKKCGEGQKVKKGGLMVYEERKTPHRGASSKKARRQER